MLRCITLFAAGFPGSADVPRGGEETKNREVIEQ